MNHLCGEKLQLTTRENSINSQSAERIGKGKHGGRTPAAKLRSRNKSLLTQSIRNIEEEMGRVPTPLPPIHSKKNAYTGELMNKREQVQVQDSGKTCTTLCHCRWAPNDQPKATGEA